MRSARLLAVAVLTVVLAFSSAQNTFASVELFYDDGTQTGGQFQNYAGVIFTVSNSMRVVGIRLMSLNVGAYTGYITGPDHTTVLKSFPVTVTVVGGQWNTVTITDGPVVSGDFYVVIQEIALGHDSNGDGARSYAGASLAGLSFFPNYDWMLRALVSSGEAVGGVVESVNTLVLLSPWVVVIGLVGCIGAVVVVAKKRRT